MAHARWLAERFPGRAWIAVELLCGPDDRARLAELRELGAASGLPLVAAGDVHMHVRSRRRLQDTLTAIRLRMPVAAAAMRFTRTPSVICGCGCAWRTCIPPSCSPRR